MDRKISDFLQITINGSKSYDSIYKFKKKVEKKNDKGKHSLIIKLKEMKKGIEIDKDKK